MGRLITIAMSDGVEVEVYHVTPQRERQGGLVLVQEIFGLTDHIREQCDRFAAEGFEVLAPALFHRVAPGLQLSYSSEDIAKAIELVRAHPLGLAVSDVATCVERLHAGGPVFTLGYCYGGSVSWAAAARLEYLNGAVCYYGGKLPQLVVEHPRCRILVHLGRDDHEIPMRSTRDALEKHALVDVLTYPAGHGFNSDRRADYDALSAQLALRESLRFLSEHA